MPELPDLTVYAESIMAHFGAQRLSGLRVASPFVLRTFDPPAQEFLGRRLEGVSLVGKRLLFAFEGGLSAAIHLMIAGRFSHQTLGKQIPAKVGLLAFDFESGSLVLSEFSKKKRASLHLFRSRSEVQALDRGGLPVLSCSFEDFKTALTRERRTLKRALTDPSIFSGIGNAYSDEILFWAELGPVRRTDSLDTSEIERLFAATRHTLQAWTRLLRRQTGASFPTKVTAFRPEMAVHGRFGKPCIVCGTIVQRIRYADNEANYCPRCQTKGKVLADRSLSQLLKGDFPRTLEALEEMPGKMGGK